MIIEDEAAIRTNLLELLDAEGHSVMSAENGCLGVQLAGEFLPDLIICDILMPELDGYGVLTELRQDPLTVAIPFVFLTAWDTHADLRQGMNLGADDYLTKPFTRDELLSAISARLEKQGQLSEYYNRKLDELRRTLAESLPHEFLTPLTVILAASEILHRHSDALEPGEAPIIAERIHTSGERLHRLIRNFLLYTRLEQAAVDPVSAAALFHRKALAGPKRPEFAALDRRSQKIVRTLSVLLRMAENLNRGHTNVVRHAALRAAGRKKITLAVHAAGDCQLELWGVQSNQAAFEKELGRAMVIELVANALG